MTPTTKLKLIGCFFAVLLVLNLVLASFMMISWGIFWLVLAVIGAIAYWGIPWYKKRKMSC